MGDTESFWATQKIFGRRRRILGGLERFWATQNSSESLKIIWGRHRNFLCRPLSFWATQRNSASPRKFLSDVEDFHVAQKVFGRHRGDGIHFSLSRAAPIPGGRPGGPVLRSLRASS